MFKMITPGRAESDSGVVLEWRGRDGLSYKDNTRAFILSIEHGVTETNQHYTYVYSVGADDNLAEPNLEEVEKIKKDVAEALPIMGSPLYEILIKY